MHSDQPLVAELVCKFLRARILVRPWEQHGAMTPAEAIREVIEKVMARDDHHRQPRHRHHQAAPPRWPSSDLGNNFD
jgi:hypothetical protein